MKPTKPIFVVGLGRSGSSIFHEMLSTHQQVAWLSSICDKYPEKPRLNRIVLNGLNIPFVGKQIRRIYGPAECYSFWENYCRGFRTPCRDLVAEDLTPKSKKQIIMALSEVITINRKRLLLKITGWPRIGYLKAIADDAVFIHVKRDARAVANSFLAVPWWWGWRGPGNWRWGELPLKYAELWQKYDRSFVALAGIACRIFQDSIDQAKQKMDNSNFMEINYEELCDRPVGIFQQVAEFCDLDWTSEFENSIHSFSLKSSNYKWQEDLTSHQQMILEKVLTTDQ